MKLRTQRAFNFFLVNGASNMNQVPIPAGCYSVKLQPNPSGRDNEQWYILTDPGNEVKPEYAGKRIGVAKIWVISQSEMIILP